MRRAGIIAKLLLSMVWAAFYMPASGQDSADTLRFTVEEAQSYAMEHSTSMKNARLDVKIADKEVWETTAQGLPQVSASGTYDNNLSLTTQLFPNFIEPTIMQVLIEQGVLPPDTPIGDPDMIEVKFGTQHNFTGSVMVNQLIFSGPYIVGLQASRVYKDLSQQRKQQSGLDVKANVANTYHSILLTQRNIQILEENLASLKASLKDSRALYQQGMAEQTDVDQVQISVTSVENSLKGTRRQLEQLRNLMKIQLGMPLEQPIKLTQGLREILQQANLEAPAEQEFTVENNITYQLMDTQMQLSELDLKRRKSQYLPTLSAYYNLRENAMRDQFNPLDPDKKWYQASTLGFQLNLPIFSSGQRYVRVQKAKLNLQKTQNNLSDTRKSLNNQFIQAKNNYMTAHEQYKSSKENMELAKRVYSRLTKKYSEGMASSMELTQANRDYLNAESQYIGALVEMLNARTKLRKVLNEL